MDDLDVSSSVDDDVGLPKTTVTKMIQELLPPEIGCTREARDLVLNCCSEFVHLIASEASEICEKGNKKLIGGEHVIEALKTLGFDHYVNDVSKAMTDVKEEAKAHRWPGNRPGNGMTAEELQREQERLFEAARLKYQQDLEMFDPPAS